MIQHLQHTLVRAVTALALTGGMTVAHAEFVRENGVGISLGATEWGLVCSGCPFAWQPLMGMDGFAPGAIDLQDGAAGDHWSVFASSMQTGQFSGFLGNASASASGGRRIGEGTVDGFTNPNTTWHAEAGAFADWSMLLVNDQDSAMRYTVTVDMAGDFWTSSDLGQATPSSIIGGATAFVRDADPQGEGNEVLGFWSHSAFAGGVLGPDATGSFDVVVPVGGSFWLWAYAGANAVAIDTSLDPDAGHAGIDAQSGAVVALHMTAVPVPEPHGAMLGIAGLVLLGRLVRRRGSGCRSVASAA